MSTPALDVENVTKRYTPLTLPGFSRRGSAKEVTALSDISFRVEPGEMVGLLGPNGAGKTTLLKIITTLIYPSSGHVKIYGRDIAHDPIGARGEIGLVTCDERSFYWRLTGRQNLNFFGRLYGLDKAETERRCDELMDMLGLSHARDRVYQKYSSGMRQKLAVARGLLSDPRIIFYDEPTRSLDPLSSQSIRTWIRNKRRNSPEQTHIIATNQLGEAEELCDRVFIINEGRLVAHGTIDEIRRLYPLRDYDSHVLICHAGDDTVAGLQISGVPGLIDLQIGEAGENGTRRVVLQTASGSVALSAVLRKFIDAGVTVVSANTEQVAFDDIFCSLVGADNSEPSSEGGRNS